MHVAIWHIPFLIYNKEVRDEKVRIGVAGMVEYWLKRRLKNEKQESYGFDIQCRRSFNVPSLTLYGSL